MPETLAEKAEKRDPCPCNARSPSPLTLSSRCSPYEARIYPADDARRPPGILFGKLNLASKAPYKGLPASSTSPSSKTYPPCPLPCALVAPLDYSRLSLASSLECQCPDHRSFGPRRTVLVLGRDAKSLMLASLPVQPFTSPTKTSKWVVETRAGWARKGEASPAS